MCQPAIVTLPITPRKSPKIGLMFIPFIMDVLGKKIGIKKMLGLNVNGAKLFDQDIEDNVCGYINVNSWLGIVPDKIWRDDQKENIYWINTFFQQLQNNGYIIRDNRLILRCSCKAVEMLAVADNISLRKRLYEKVSNIIHCKICKTPVVEMVDNVYLFKIKHFQPSVGSVIPNFTYREVCNLSKRFAGVEFLISRSRPSAMKLWMGKEYIFLDPDFGWQLYLPLIRRYGFDPCILIGSQENLFGCYLMILLQWIIDKKESTLIVPGYCKTKSKSDELITSKFQEWDRNTVRLYLASHVTFRKKEMTIDTSLMYLINKVILHAARDQFCVPIQQLLMESMNNIEGNKVCRLLTESWRNRKAHEELITMMV